MRLAKLVPDWECRAAASHEPPAVVPDATIDLVVETPGRDRLWAAQTPQVFRAALLREAHARALQDDFRSTDDSALVERLGHPVRLVSGSPENLKITRAADLILAEQILRARTLEARSAG